MPNDMFCSNSQKASAFSICLSRWLLIDSFRSDGSVDRRPRPACKRLWEYFSSTRSRKTIHVCISLIITKVFLLENFAVRFPVIEVFVFSFLFIAKDMRIFTFVSFICKPQRRAGPTIEELPNPREDAQGTRHSSSGNREVPSLVEAPSASTTVGGHYSTLPPC